MVEVWKDIPGHEGFYQVSDLGRVKSTSRQLKTSVDSAGYFNVCLSIQGIRKTFRVSHLVVLAFIGPRPIGMDVCHNDGNKKNNILSNLRYDTRSNNHSDKILHGTNCEGEKIHFAKLTKFDIPKIRSLLIQGEVQQQIADLFGITTRTIRHIKRGEIWKHVP